MKKLLVYTLLLIPIAFFSCKKETSTTAPTQTIPDNGWKVGTNAYTQAYCARVALGNSNNSLIASDGGNGSASSGNTNNELFFGCIVGWKGLTEIFQHNILNGRLISSRCISQNIQREND